MSATTATLPTSGILFPSALQSAAASSYIGVTSKTLANWRALGEGPRFIRLGKAGARILYRVSDLDAFLAEHVMDAA